MNFPDQPQNIAPYGNFNVAAYLSKLKTIKSLKLKDLKEEWENPTRYYNISPNNPWEINRFGPWIQINHCIKGSDNVDRIVSYPPLKYKGETSIDFRAISVYVQFDNKKAIVSDLGETWRFLTKNVQACLETNEIGRVLNDISKEYIREKDEISFEYINSESPLSPSNTIRVLVDDLKKLPEIIANVMACVWDIAWRFRPKTDKYDRVLMEG